MNFVELNLQEIIRTDFITASSPKRVCREICLGNGDYNITIEMENYYGDDVGIAGILSIVHEMHTLELHKI